MTGPATAGVTLRAPRLLVVTPVDVARAGHLDETAASVGAAAQVLAPLGTTLVWSVCLDGTGPDPVPAVPVVPAAEVHVAHLVGHWGTSAARNVALCATDSDWVFPLDADDVLHPSGLPAVCAELATGRAWVASSRTELDGRPSRSAVPCRQEYLPGELNAVYRHPFVFHPNNVAYRTEVLLGAGGWPALPGGEDTALVLTVARRHPGVALEDVTVGYRRWSSQVCATEAFAADAWARHGVYAGLGLLGGRPASAVRRTDDGPAR